MTAVLTKHQTHTTAVSANPEWYHSHTTTVNATAMQTQSGTTLKAVQTQSGTPSKQCKSRVAPHSKQCKPRVAPHSHHRRQCKPRVATLSHRCPGCIRYDPVVRPPDIHPDARVSDRLVCSRQKSAHEARKVTMATQGERAAVDNKSAHKAKPRDAVTEPRPPATQAE